MTIIKFQEVRLTSRRYVTIDGKRKFQQRTFMQTVNPFNLREDGSQKTRNDIFDELTRESDKWQAEDIR